MQKTYKIAEHIVNIDTVFDDTQLRLKDYVSNEKPEFFIKTTLEDIEFEREGAIKEALVENVPLINYSDMEYESTAVHRKLAEKLFDFNILLCHGSVVSVDNRAYMFIAKSGTGKSTHTRMWRELFGDRAIMVNDDKPFIKVTKNNVDAYGSPWNGKHHLGNNISVPLKGICILRRGETNSIEEVDFKKAYPMILQQTYKLSGRDNMLKLLELVDTMAKNVKFYIMHCNISIDSAKMSYEVMSKGE